MTNKQQNNSKLLREARQRQAITAAEANRLHEVGRDLQRQVRQNIKETEAASQKHFESVLDVEEILLDVKLSLAGNVDPTNQPTERT